MNKIKVLQFGEGNFLRCFVDYKIQLADNAARFDGDVGIVIPIDNDMTKFFDAQNNKYNVYLNGIKDGKVIEEITPVDVVQKIVNPYRDFDAYRELYLGKDLQVVVSNTTEAGIAYNADDKFDDSMNCTFPAKVTKLLYDRFKTLGAGYGLTFLAVELIEFNGQMLRKYILQYAEQWDLGADFIEFVKNENVFCDTLVDRIVTGFPRQNKDYYFAKLGKEDNLLTVGEPYFLWVIQADGAIKAKATWLDDADIVFTDNIKPYRERKVKILNGMHTMTVPIALLSGIETVGEAMKAQFITDFLNKCVKTEILPTINLPEDQKAKYLASIFERFANPFVQHSFWSISLNSTSKWKTRVFATFKDNMAINGGKIPKLMAFSFAALLEFYVKNIDNIKDSPEVLEYYKNKKAVSALEVVHDVMSNAAWWGEDMTKLADFEGTVIGYIKQIETDGIKAATVAR